MKQALLTVAAALCLILSPAQIKRLNAHAFVPTEETFTVDNECSYAPFVVTIEGANSEAVDIGVSDIGQYSGDVSFTATAVEIENHTVQYPDTADIQLLNDAVIKVSWQNQDLVQVTNEIGQN